MSLTPFADNQGNLSLYAALEQATLNNALYSDKPDYVRSVANAAGGGVAEVVSNNAPADFGSGGDNRPCYTCFTQGGEFWWILQGTYTARQWLENASGFFNTAGLGSSNQAFHGAWASMATKLLADFRAKVSDDDTRPINISGHSLGGAVAWDLAALLKQTFPGRVVRVMTFGSPRPMRGSYTGTRPTVAYDVQLRADVVTYLPPNLPLSLSPDWQQQGVKTVVSSGGEILAPTANDGEIGLSLIGEGSIRDHLAGSYVAALLARYETLEASAVTDAILAAASVTGSPSIITPTTNGGQPVGLFKRAVFQFSDPSRRTWTEVLYYANTASDLTVVQKDAATLLDKRVRLFGFGPKVLNTYVSDDDFVRDALYVQKPGFEVGDGTWNKSLLRGQLDEDESDFPWTTLLLRMRSGNRTVKPSYIGGIPDGMSIDDGNNKVRDANFSKAFKLWQDEVIAKWGWKGINVDPNAEGGTKNITAITVANSQFTYTTNGNHGLVQGNWVTVQKTKGQGGNANGVILVETVPSATTFVGSKTAPADYRYLIGGTVQKRGYTVYPIQEIFLRAFTEKKRGGSVALPRGRQRKKKS